MGLFNRAKASKDDETEKNPAEIEIEKKESKKPDRGIKVALEEVRGVLIRPLITEKSAFLGPNRQYVFAVKRSANKIQVAKAIMSRYQIKPESVNIIRNSGKKVRYGRSLGRTKDWKKAIVTLPEGASIEVNEGK